MTDAPIMASEGRPPKPSDKTVNKDAVAAYAKKARFTAATLREELDESSPALRKAVWELKQRADEFEAALNSKGESDDAISIDEHIQSEEHVQSEEEDKTLFVSREFACHHCRRSP
ncbi:hypothetical protein CKAH01_18434 [Colletotrichum kahawae]|uniref:Uncharacterized protein n=1 Tax=Colletotrichum kahawae TaxID=34407 RepID=A0AAD9Y7U4_COLKA|nr:hypothetical protein CKAH01_18434 [Colletotrichum kahawae]